MLRPAGPARPDLAEAVDSYLRNLDVEERNTTLGTLAQEAVHSKRASGLSAAYIPTFESRLRTF